MKRNKPKAAKSRSLEIIFYENIIKERPDFVSALISLGDAYTRKGFYSEGLRVDRKLVNLKPDDPVIHYNLACSLSLTGKPKVALEELEKAVSLGYDDFSYILEDADLEAVRNSEEFKTFFNNLTKFKS